MKISYTVCVNESDLYRAMREKRDELFKEKRKFNEKPGTRIISTDTVAYHFTTAEHLNTFHDELFRGLHIDSLQFTDSKYVKLSVDAWLFIMERRAAGNILTEDL